MGAAQIEIPQTGKKGIQRPLTFLLNAGKHLGILGGKNFPFSGERFGYQAFLLQKIQNIVYGGMLVLGVFRNFNRRGRSELKQRQIHPGLSAVQPELIQLFDDGHVSSCNVVKKRHHLFSFQGLKTSLHAII